MDKDFSYEPVHTAEPNAPIAEAVPSNPDAEGKETENPSDLAVMVGCGLVGWVVAGPFMAFLTALGGKYAADHNQGPIGESSRAVGRITAAAGRKAKDEHLWCKIKAAARSIFKGKNGHCESCNN